LIEARNVAKFYMMGSVKVEALRGVSIKIEEGDFTVIVGPSGSGKSTLMHILGALDRPSSGEVILDGKNITKLDEWHLDMIRRNKIGFVFQSFNLIPTLNAIENVIIPLEPTSVPKELAIKKAVGLLRLMGLGERMRHKPTEMSGGERQRVSICRALINDPEIIFADEPTGNLDTKTGKAIVDMMRKLNREGGKTFVIVTHDTSLLDYASKRIYLRDGLIESVSRGRARTSKKGKGV